MIGPWGALKALSLVPVLTTLKSEVGKGEATFAESHS